jgi:hypothetical protein
MSMIFGPARLCRTINPVDRAEEVCGGGGPAGVRPARSTSLIVRRHGHRHGGQLICAGFLAVPRGRLVATRSIELIVRQVSPLVPGPGARPVTVIGPSGTAVRSARHWRRARSGHARVIDPNAAAARTPRH